MVELVVHLLFSSLSFFVLTEKTVASHLHTLSIIPLFLPPCLGETGVQVQAVYPTHFLHHHQETVCHNQFKIEKSHKLNAILCFWKIIKLTICYLIQLPSAPSSLLGAPHTTVSTRAWRIAPAHIGHGSSVT